MCYNCSEFFHSAKNCKCKLRCIKCGEPHETRLCPIWEKIENPTCINCKESGHVASWRGCPKYPVIKTISYADKLKRNLPNAEKPVKNNQENHPTLQAQKPEFPDLEKKLNALKVIYETLNRFPNLIEISEKIKLAENDLEKFNLLLQLFKVSP
ncbi:hypothetical protein AVEN_198912-1 [Araneus ventricosus]|uniref:CCHC-type domain-containing protein n=1 Tax=Araneus ventricosus TaxID=182803 RepID=A0A4Y2MNI4_ARAVE|nr:hypothetical protein AVEN_198912-1 [Araneus ventricosus]